jgi:multiple antibiotic resistance protein
MTETAILAFTTFFATISPVDVAVLFAVMTNNSSAQAKRSMAMRGCLIALVVLVGFALAGSNLLETLGISLAALKFAGGILLLLIAIDMVFARTSGGASTTDEERLEGQGKEDISVFPLATPLIAGPGTMGALILLTADTKNDPASLGVILAMLTLVIVITFVLLMLATQVQKLLGVTGMNVIARVFGVLLAALAVQFMFDGLARSGIIPG